MAAQRVIRENSRMSRKPERFTWDDEPGEKTTTFESSTQSVNSTLQDDAVARRLKERRAAAKSGMLKVVVVVIALLAVSGALIYQIAKRH